MVKEFLHICRTYSVTFRYIKKQESIYIIFFLFIYIIFFLFF